jgi:hypothetical protein
MHNDVTMRMIDSMTAGCLWCDATYDIFIPYVVLDMSSWLHSQCAEHQACCNNARFDRLNIFVLHA